MSRCATYRIIERADGRLDITVTSTSGLTVRREGFPSVAEAQAALQDLRVVLAANTWHLVHAGGPALA